MDAQALLPDEERLAAQITARFEALAEHRMTIEAIV